MEIENCACGGLAACCPKCGGQVLPVVDVTWVPQIHDYRELMRRYECFRCGLRGPDHHRDRVAWRRFKRLARSMRRMKED